MTDIIRLLPANVANQIAAGEVVQRPASAVKELLENAIDAGADHIILRIRDAGKELIHVIDNGKGMSPNDARMAFERHATSKISHSDDLFKLTTKGFRGEALASIAAVSQVELKTKQHDAEIGTRLLVESSQVKLQEPEVCAEGTSIAVSNLFYNIPARRNFLRSNAIESKHIIEEFHRVALAHPGIRFEMITNNSETYVLLPSGVRQRIVSIFGKKYNERLVPLDEVTDVVKISGFISKPEFTRKKRGEQFFFVNGRFIKSSYLNHAVQSSYAELIGSDEFPSWFVFLDIDPARIDINIHPTKTEVKFEDERPIYAILHSAVRSSLGRFNIKPSIDFEVDPIFDQVFSKERTIKPPTVSINTAYNPFESEPNSSKPQKRIEEFFVWSGGDGSKKVDFNRLSAEMGSAESEQEQLTIEHDEDRHTSPKPSVFQLDARYIVSHIRSGIVVIHQQRAHERILYEQFAALEHTPSSQQLMFPIEVPLNAEERVLAAEQIDLLTAYGFQVEIANDRMIFQSVPAVLEEFDASSFCQLLLDRAEHGGELHNLQEHALRALARTQSIQSGKRLNALEMNNLIDELFACKEPKYTPSGQPVIVTFTLHDLMNRFK